MAKRCVCAPACEEFICDISREPETRGIYHTNKLPNISRCIAPIGHGLCYKYAMLNFDDAYNQKYKTCHYHSNIVYI